MEFNPGRLNKLGVGEAEDLKKKFKKQVKFLVRNLRHPSLRCKKYDERRWNNLCL